MNRPLPDLSIVLIFLREGQGWSQSRLAEAARISNKLVNDYESGRKRLHRKRLERLIAFMGLGPERIEATLATLHDNRASSRAPADAPEDRFAEKRRRVEVLAERGMRLAGGFLREFFSLLSVEGEALFARERAAILWRRLQGRTHEQRMALVAESPKLRTWALCEKAAAESIAAAPNQPREALNLAHLSLRIAELAPGTQTWRQRLQGYAWAHVANGRKVCNDLPAADDAMARARKLWEAGAPGDPGLLNPAWLPGLEAALRKEQRRFPEALKRIDEALVLDRGELRAQILITKSGILEALGNPDGSTEVLREAAPYIDVERDPRLAFSVRFNLLVDLCRLERAAEAEPGLPEVQALAERLGGELDLGRTVWLRGSVAAGLGRAAEAEAAFLQVQRVFEKNKLPYDYALVSLELAVLFLEQVRTAEVHGLAERMLAIFQAEEVHREALAALQVFYDASRRETATAELARRILKYLHRAQHDPKLRFSEEGAEAQ
jgi:transcriptional regulator with XRE-family HTH domain